MSRIQTTLKRSVPIPVAGEGDQPGKQPTRPPRAGDVDGVENFYMPSMPDPTCMNQGLAQTGGYLTRASVAYHLRENLLAFFRNSVWHGCGSDTS